MALEPTAQQVLAAARYAEEHGHDDDARNAYQYILQAFPGCEEAVIAQNALNAILLKSLRAAPSTSLPIEPDAVQEGLGVSPAASPVHVGQNRSEAHHPHLSARTRFHQAPVEPGNGTGALADAASVDTEANLQQRSSQRTLKSRGKPGAGWRGLPVAVVAGIIATVVGGLILYVLQDSIFGIDPKLNGKVFSLDGKPLAGAKVAIANRALSTLSKDDGSFALDYVPGAFDLVVSKKGFYAHTSKLEINEKTEYALNDITLHPPASKAHFQIVDGAQTRSIPHQNVKVTGFNFAGGDESDSATHLLIALRNTAQKLTNIPRVPAGPVAIIDAGRRGYKLVRLNLAADIFPAETAQPVWRDAAAGTQRDVMALAAGNKIRDGRIDTIIEAAPGQKGSYFEQVEASSYHYASGGYNVVRADLEPGIYALGWIKLESDRVTLTGESAFVFAVGDGASRLSAVAEKASSDDDAHWEKAKQSGSIASLEGYLKLFPQGVHVEEAKRLAEAQKLQRSFAEGQSIARMSLSADGSQALLVRVDEDRNETLEVVDLASGQTRYTMTSIDGTSVRAFKSSVDGRFAVSWHRVTRGIGHGVVIRLWDFATGKLIAERTNTGSRDCHDGLSLARVPGGSQFALPCARAVQIWNAQPFEPVIAVADPEDDHSFERVAVSPDGRFMAGASSGKLVFWNLETRQSIFERNSRSYARKWSKILFTPDGSHFLAGDKSSTYVFGGNGEGEVREIEGVNGYLAAASDTHFAVYRTDGFEVLRLSDGGSERTFSLAGGVSSVNFANDPRRLFTSSKDGLVREWTLD